MSTSIYTIYKITNQINNKIYIGFTSQNIHKRFTQHCSKKKKSVISSAIQKYGKENFIIDRIYESTDKDDTLNNKEPYYIKKYNSRDRKIGYNISNGGEYFKHSPESKKQMSESKKGGVPWNKGKSGIYSEETLKKISDSSKNRVYKKGSEHHLFGKKQSDTHINKIKQSKYKTFEIIDSNNNIHICNSGLKTFCKNQNMDYRTMQELRSGNYIPTKRSKFYNWKIKVL